MKYLSYYMLLFLITFWASFVGAGTPIPYVTNSHFNTYSSARATEGLAYVLYSSATKNVKLGSRTVTASAFIGPLTGTASGNLISGGALGTPSSGNLANCTFPTLNQNTSGTAGGLSGGPNIVVGTVNANITTASAMAGVVNIGGGANATTSIASKKTTSGAGALDTGVSINQGVGGGAMLLLVSYHGGTGTATGSALYLVRFYYDGNNAPTTSYIAGSSDFVTFGVSAGNTLTLSIAGQAQLNYTWVGNK